MKQIHEPHCVKLDVQSIHQNVWWVNFSQVFPTCSIIFTEPPYLCSSTLISITVILPANTRGIMRSIPCISMLDDYIYANHCHLPLFFLLANNCKPSTQHWKEILYYKLSKLAKSKGTIRTKDTAQCGKNMLFTHI